MLAVDQTFLVLIDIQTKLWNVMYEKEALSENTQKLIKGLQLLGVPVILTEQNPAGLGPTLPDLTVLLPEIKPMPKFCFQLLPESGLSECGYLAQPKAGPGLRHRGPYLRLSNLS